MQKEQVHHVQSQQDVEGHPVVYSLGKLVFDGGRAAASWWSHGELLEVRLGADGQILCTRTIPVALKNGSALTR